MSSETVARLRDKLASLHPADICIEDESSRHRGHAGAKEGGHFRLRIVADCFEGKGTAARHRLVYAAIGNLQENGIHALSMTALTPGEV